MARILHSRSVDPQTRFEIVGLSGADNRLSVKDNLERKVYRIQTTNSHELATLCTQTDEQWLKWFEEQGPVK